MPTEIKPRISIVSTGESGAAIQKTEATIVYTNRDGSYFSHDLTDYIVIAASGNYLPNSYGNLATAETALFEHELEIAKARARSLAEALQGGPTEPGGGGFKP